MAVNSSLCICAVYGNDDDRCVWVDPEDLHPQSRLKTVIVRNGGESVRWGCSRETLICLIASQRYNRIITRGLITQEEIVAEIDRDCIDVGVHVPVCDDILLRMCKKLVFHIVRWPLLKVSMQKALGGGATDIACSHSFFYLTFPRKIFIGRRDLQNIRDERPVKELTMYLSMEIAQWEEYDKTWSAEQLATFLRNLDANDVIRRITGNGEDPFWFAKYDWGNSTHMRIDARIFHAIRSVLNETNIRNLLSKLNDEIPNLEAIFRATPLQSLEQKVLESTFHENGLELYWNLMNSNLSLRPVRFPTIWLTAATDKSDYQLIYVQKKWA